MNTPFFEQYKSDHHPGERGSVVVWQEYARDAYLTLFFVLAALIYQRLVTESGVLIPGVIGIFTIITLSNIYGWIKMRNTFVEAGFTGDKFYLKNVYDVIKEKEPLMFPLMYANPRKEGNQLWVHYYGRVIPISLSEWDEPGELIRHFNRL